MEKNKIQNLLITRGIHVFPNTSTTIEIGRKISTNAIDDCVEKKTNIIVVSQKSPSLDTPKKATFLK